MPIDDQFKGLPMDNLIGEPLKAAADAQAKLAKGTAEFIKNVGFVVPKDDEQKAPPED